MNHRLTAARQLILAALGVIVAIGSLSMVGAPADAAQSVPASVWLTHLNQMRAMAGAPPVTEDAALSAADAKHVTYMLANGLTHVEDSSKPEYTPEGATAGLKSVLASIWGWDGEPHATEAIDIWGSSVYHAFPILDPAVTSVGYADGSNDFVHSMYALDARSNRTGSVGSGIMYPQGTQVPFTAFSGNESPNPLAYCPNLTPGQVGLPILATFPGHAANPTTATLVRVAADSSTTPVEVCTLGAAQGLSYNGVAMMPKGELVHGATYRATITVDGVTKTWSFTVAKVPVSFDFSTGYPIEYGSPVTLGVAAYGAEDGAPVTVEYQAPGQSGWTSIGTSTVASGGFGFTFTPPAVSSVTLRFTYAGTSTTTAATGTFTLPLTAPAPTNPTTTGGGTDPGTTTGGVRQIVGWSTAPVTIRAHHAKTFTVTVRPGLGVVQLGRSKTSAGIYRTVATFSVAADHTARIRVPAKAGFYRVRIPSLNGYTAKVSAAKKVRVRS